MKKKKACYIYGREDLRVVIMGTCPVRILEMNKWENKEGMQ
jgi:hypothetical protein